MKKGTNINSLLRKILHGVAKVALAIIAIAAAFGFLYWYNNTLFMWEAKIIWPQDPFSETKFKSGPAQERRRMVVDLIRSKKFIGVDSDKVPTLLGAETGDYYYSDSNSTYRLTDNGNADWILTFVSDGDGKIGRVFIRKSCCSVSKKMLYVSLDLADPIIKNLIKLHAK